MGVGSIKLELQWKKEKPFDDLTGNGRYEELAEDRRLYTVAKRPAEQQNTVHSTDGLYCGTLYHFAGTERNARASEDSLFGNCIGGLADESERVGGRWYSVQMMCSSAGARAVADGRRTVVMLTQLLARCVVPSVKLVSCNPHLHRVLSCVHAAAAAADSDDADAFSCPRPSKAVSCLTLRNFTHSAAAAVTGNFSARPP